MIKLDGYEVALNDNVYDVVFGAGTVSRLLENEDKFCVSFGPQLRYYDSRGNTTFGVRTLYWRDPVTVIPHKEDNAWDLTMQITQSVANILGRKQ
jgi:hypothetical protein